MDRLEYINKEPVLKVTDPTTTEDHFYDFSESNIIPQADSKGYHSIFKHSTHSSRHPVMGVNLYKKTDHPTMSLHDGYEIFSINPNKLYELSNPIPIKCNELEQHIEDADEHPTYFTLLIYDFLARKIYEINRREQ
eukprot:789161_1